jgi:hypothetical protein
MTAFDTAPDAQELLEYVMWHAPGAPRKQSVAIELLRGLTVEGLAQLRAEMRYKARTFQNAGMPDTYNPWGRD